MLVESPDQTERASETFLLHRFLLAEGAEPTGAQTPKLDTRASATREAETARLEPRPRCLQAATAAAARCLRRQESRGRSGGCVLHSPERLHRKRLTAGGAQTREEGTSLAVYTPTQRSRPTARDGGLQSGISGLLTHVVHPNVQILKIFIW